MMTGKGAGIEAIAGVNDRGWCLQRSGMYGDHGQAAVGVGQAEPLRDVSTPALGMGLCGNLHDGMLAAAV